MNEKESCFLNWEKALSNVSLNEKVVTFNKIVSNILSNYTPFETKAAEHKTLIKEKDKICKIALNNNRT